MGYKRDTLKCESCGTTFDCTWRILKKDEIWSGEYPKNVIYGEGKKINERYCVFVNCPKCRKRNRYLLNEKGEVEKAEDGKLKNI